MPATTPISYQDLSKHIQALGYDIDTEGMCYGVAQMAKQAILANEIDRFDKRLALIQSVTPDELVEKIKKIKNQHLNKEPFSEEDLSWLEIPGFFEGVSLYQEPESYPQLFPADHAPTHQDADQTHPLLLTKKLNEMGGIECLDTFSGVYNQKQLTKFFASLQASLQPLASSSISPLAFTLESSNHAITIGYNPNENIWYFVNANSLPSIRTTSPEELADKVISAFSNNGISIFRARIYTAKNYDMAFLPCINEWKNKKSWKKIHNVTLEKARIIDSCGASWLHLAAEDNAPLVEKLLANKANPNQMSLDGYFPLFYAVCNNQGEVVSKLLMSGANPNLCTNNATPLLIATSHNKIDIVKRFFNPLNSIPTNVNTNSTEYGTALLTAVANESLDIAHVLLKNKANPNLGCITDGLTPLFLAAQEGHQDLLRLLLGNGANMNVSFENDIDSLRDFALKRNVEKSMEAMITRKQESASQTILLTPAEIAEVMGHTEINNILAYQRALESNAQKNAARHQAYETCKQKCQQSKDAGEALTWLNKFELVDKIAQTFAQKYAYRPELIFHKETAARKEKRRGVSLAIDAAYLAFTNGENTQVIIDQLQERIKNLKQQSAQGNSHSQANEAAPNRRDLAR